MLGAIFMATDYVTSPVTPKGQIVFGIGCGLLTVFIRYFGGLPEGVCIPRTPGRTFGPCSAGRLAAGGHPSLPGAPGVLFPINVLCSLQPF